MQFKFNKQQNSFLEISFFEILFLSFTAISIFFLFVSGKEIIGYWGILGCFLTTIAWVWLKNEEKYPTLPTILIAISIPLVLHVLIGLVQVAYRFYEVYCVSVFENTNFRGHVSIGVKNLSIVASLLAVTGHCITGCYVRYRATGLAFILLSLSLIGFLNSWMGILCYCTYLIVNGVKNFDEDKKNEAKQFFKSRIILRPALLGLIALVIAFPFSGGEERFRLIENSVIAAINKDTSSAWIDPKNFVTEFCQDPTNVCRVDASIYYRLSWGIFGLQAILENPLGLGNVDKPLQHLFNIKYPALSTNFNDDFHSEIISFGVRFGFVALAIIFVLVCYILLSLFKITDYKKNISAQLAAGFLIIIFIRLLGDSVGWPVLFALIFLLFLSLISIKFKVLRGSVCDN